MARRKASGTLTLTKHDAADTRVLIDLYISTGRLKVTRCPEGHHDEHLSLRRKRGGGMLPGHLDPRFMGEPCAT